MSFFGDIADAVGDAAGWVEHAASDVSHSAIGETILNAGGSLFGDPQLGSQIKTGTGIIDKIFGKGSPAGKTLSRAAKPSRTIGLGRPPASLASQIVRVKIGGRYVRMSKRQLAGIVQRLRQRSPGKALLAPPITLTAPPQPPPPPPPVVLAPPALRAILTNPEAVQAAVESGTPIQLPGGQVLNPETPVRVPVGMEQDVISLGLSVVEDHHDHFDDDTGAGSKFHEDL